MVELGGDFSSRSEGDNVLISCNVNQFQPSYILSWSKDGQSIIRGETIIDDDLQNRHDGQNFYFVFDSEDVTNSAYSFINFPSITKDDSGSYACEVYQVTEGNNILLISKSVDVDVMYFPSADYPKCSPKDQVFVKLGEPLAISCFSEEGNPVVNLTWTRDFGDNNFIPVEGISSRGNGFVNSELVIPQTTLQEQKSNFVCSLNSLQKTLRICSVRTQIVLPEPLISISPEVGVGSIGQSVEFTCFSYLEMNAVFWSSQPEGIQTDSRVTISQNRQILTLSNITARDNDTVIFCSFQFKDSWIQANAFLYVEDALAKPKENPTNNIGSSSSSAVGSPLDWMIAFIVVCLTVIVVSLIYFIRKRLKSKGSNGNADIVYDPGNEVPPYVINRIGGGPHDSRSNESNEYLEGHDYSTMEVGENAPSNGGQNASAPSDGRILGSQNRHRPLHRINERMPPARLNHPQERNESEAADEVRGGRTSELENPEYMTQGNFMASNAPNRPIRIRNFSHVSEATTVEPDYMPVEI